MFQQRYVVVFKMKNDGNKNMKTVIPYHKENYNCVQNMVYTLSRFYAREYQMFLLEGWGIKYNGTMQGLSHRVDFVLKGFPNREYLLSKYHGISYVHNVQSPVYISNISAYLDEKRLGIYWDTYDCRWLNTYQKTRGIHFCLITNCDNRYIYCIDQFSTCCDEIVLPKEFLSMNHGVVYIDKLSMPHIEYKEYINEIKQTIVDFKKFQCLDNYSRYLNDLQNEELLSYEITHTKDLRASNAMMQLRYMANNKMNLIEALEYVQSKTGVSFDRTIQKLKTLYLRYSKIRAIILKGILMKKISNYDTLCGECMSIEEEEREMLDSLEYEINIHEKNTSGWNA